MLKIRSGMLKKVLTNEQFEMINQNQIKIRDIKIESFISR